jgi:hypothetical protein
VQRKNGKDAEKKQDAVSDVTVKWRKFALKSRFSVLRRAETFSDQDCEIEFYTNTLDAFSRLGERDYCCDSIGSF